MRTDTKTAARLHRGVDAGLFHWAIHWKVRLLRWRPAAALLWRTFSCGYTHHGETVTSLGLLSQTALPLAAMALFSNCMQDRQFRPPSLATKRKRGMHSKTAHCAPMHAFRCRRCVDLMRVRSDVSGWRLDVGCGRGIEVAYVELSKIVLLVVACRASSNATWAGNNSAVDHAQDLRGTCSLKMSLMCAYVCLS